MRKFTAIVLVLFTIIGCEKNEIEQEIENETYYNCTDFFDSGDYSAVCIIDSEIPNILDSTIDGGGTVCSYIIPAIDNDIQVPSSVSFISLETSALVESLFENRKIQSETEAMGDTMRFYSELTIDGYDAIVSEARSANYDKSLLVQYKNVLVSTRTVFFRDWYDETPCNYETDELVALMKEVLKNM